jgi:hypothetical protein
MKIVIVPDQPTKGSAASEDWGDKVSITSPEVKTTLLSVSTIHVSETAKATIEANGLSIDEFVGWLLKAANVTQ